MYCGWLNNLVMLNCTVYQNAAKNNGEELRSGYQPAFLFLSRCRISNLHRSSWVLVTLVGAGGGARYYWGSLLSGSQKDKNRCTKLVRRSSFYELKAVNLWEEGHAWEKEKYVRIVIFNFNVLPKITSKCTFSWNTALSRRGLVSWINESAELRKSRHPLYE